MMQLFKMFDFDPMPENEVNFSRKLAKLLIDWGREGKPPSYLPNWKKLDLDDPSYLVIDEEFQVRKGYPDEERINFWRNELDLVYWTYVLEGNTLHDEL